MPRGRKPPCRSQVIYESLPSFHDLGSLHAQPLWLRYLDSVYGVASLRFPLDMKNLTLFYANDELFARKDLALVPLLGRRPLRDEKSRAISLAETIVTVGGGSAKWFGLCGRGLHDAYRLYHSPPYPETAVLGTLWIYGYGSTRASATNASAIRAPGVHPRDGFRSFTRVEVFHCSEEAKADSRDFWMYLAPGSGVYFDLGKTIAFADRCEMWRSTLTPLPRISWRHVPRCGRRHGDWLTPNASTFASLRPGRCPGFSCGTATELAQLVHRITFSAIDALARAGYDSVQLTRSQEHAIHKFEIIDLRQHVMMNASASHIDKQGAESRDWARTPCPRRGNGAFFRGWGGSEPCGVCDGKRARVRGCLHCQPP